MRSTASFLMTILSLALLGLAAWQAVIGLPWLLSAGLALSATPILGFLLLTRGRHGARRHPVMTSVLIGLGCVMTMIGVQRFGEQHQWIALMALLALAAWMAYQRWVWRRPDTDLG